MFNVYVSNFHFSFFFACTGTPTAQFTVMHDVRANVGSFDRSFIDYRVVVPTSVFLERMYVL